MPKTMRAATAYEVCTADERPGFVDIDVALIPPHVRDDLSRLALALVEECFSRPGAEEEYQAWLAKRKARLGAQTEEVTA